MPTARERRDEVALRRRRPWRMLFIVYAIALATATLWPKLELGPRVPGTDKVLHVLAFGAFTWLLWRTGWMRRRMIVVLISLACAALDEIAQGIPMLHRHVYFSDAAASMLGVLAMGAWLWALAPVGGATNRARLAMQQCAFDRVFERRRTWLLFISIGIAACVPATIAWFTLEAGIVARIIVISLGLLVAGCSAVLFLLWRRERERVSVERLCFACGAPCAGDVNEDECAMCGEAIRTGQWIAPPIIPARARLRLLMKPMGWTLIVLVAGVAGMFAFALGYETLLKWETTSRPALRIAHLLGGMNRDLGSVVDTALIAVLFAAAARMYRVRLARLFDEPLRCMRCGFDLRGTPSPNGVGRCGECAQAFVRRAGTQST